MTNSEAFDIAFRCLDELEALPEAEKEELRADYWASIAGHDAPNDADYSWEEPMNLLIGGSLEIPVSAGHGAFSISKEALEKAFFSVDPVVKSSTKSPDEFCVPSSTKPRIRETKQPASEPILFAA